MHALWVKKTRICIDGLENCNYVTRVIDGVKRKNPVRTELVVVEIKTD